MLTASPSPKKVPPAPWPVSLFTKLQHFGQKHVPCPGAVLRGLFPPTGFLALKQVHVPDLGHTLNLTAHTHTQHSKSKMSLN